MTKNKIQGHLEEVGHIRWEKRGREKQKIGVLQRRAPPRGVCFDQGSRLFSRDGYA